ncbi:hypothetical protein [Emticicia sp. BO119]|uniref:hypothetical protein n=1 Tax=Emticicia sp. BO119 TaxID=2757768 RepID=UPI0015F03F46|nr:hypothetical protein [Emticicia sp. BO119]MBA4851289.1 hypothetical protein [Emticicia sp. BO119]
MNPYKNKNLNEFITSIPQEVIEKNTHLQDEENKRVYKEFIDNLKVGKCFICGEKMSDFVEQKPCFHWFTYPNGIKKKNFENYLNKPLGFFQLDSYFRWLANSEKLFINVNDLKEETSTTSYLETTYKYKNIEWAFSIGYTDKDGHPNAQIGAFPHYHLQMKVDDRIFLKFNDFHIPFSDHDLFVLELLEQASDRVKWGHSFGHGVGIIEDEKNLEIIDDLMITTDDSENAPFNRHTIIEAPEGQTISSEIILQAIEESKKTKKPVGKILQELLTDAKTATIIVPGKGVTKMTKRSGKK